MKIEYEATYIDINKEELRERLKSLGACLIKPETMQKRIVFNLPAGHEIKGGWLRVRDEGDRITLCLKIVDGDKIENQKEIELVVDDFASAVELLKSIGCAEKSYQENKREIWQLDEVEIMIDEWPYLEPFVEIEGETEAAVKSAGKKLNFDYSSALFCSVDMLYSKKYGCPSDVINNHIPRITFSDNNPFINR